MEKGNKTLLALLITVVILVAVFSSFGLVFFQRQPPQVTLPTATPTPTDDLSPSGAPGPGGDVTVEVTADTVQSVVETLSRPDSYYRELTLETFWGEESSATTQAQVWVDGGYTRVDASLSDGTIEHSLVGDGTRYRWYNSEHEYFSAPEREGDADLMQHIPTYEDILALDKTSITSTGYERKGGLDCVYVEAEQPDLGYLERYWVSVEQGLLVAAETVKGEQTVLRMSAYSVEIPVRSTARFALPDGTVLHTPKGS